jgi:hypothetical protein
VLLKFRTRLSAELARMKVRNKAVTNEVQKPRKKENSSDFCLVVKDLLPETVQIASYARVNRILWSDSLETAAAEVEKEFGLVFGGIIDPGLFG